MTTPNSSSSENTNTNNKQPSNIPLLTCAFLAALNSGGVTYAFGLYGANLKQNLQLTQSQLDTISSSNFCAGLLSWIPGLVIDHAGVRFSLCAGGTLSASFMMAYWAVAKQVVELPNEFLLVSTLCLLGVLIFMTNSLIIGSIFKILVVTCAPHTKGSAVGVAKGYLGIGSGVYACIFQAIKSPSLSDLDFMPMAATLYVTLVVVPALILVPNKAKMEAIFSTPAKRLDRTTTAHLRILYAGLAGLALIVVGTTLVSLEKDGFHDNDDYYNVADELVQTSPLYSKAMLILLAWLGPILSLLYLPPKPTDNYEEVGDILDAEFKPLTRTPSSPALAYGAEITQSVLETGPSGILGFKVSGLSDNPNLSLSQMLQTWPAWLFAWIVIIRVGGGTMVTNNMGQTVESLELPRQTTTPASMALFSVAQAASRVATGAISDWALSWNVHWRFTTRGGWRQWEMTGIPRPAFLIVASIAGMLAHLFMSITTTRNWFLVGVMFSGAAFGMIWPLMVLIVGEVFGTASMGANYMFYDGLSSALGTLILSKFVTQEVYERHIETNPIDDESSGLSQDGRTCYGQDCFFGSHIIIAVLSFTCVVASYLMYRATRHIYATRV